MGHALSDVINVHHLSDLDPVTPNVTAKSIVIHEHILLFPNRVLEANVDNEHEIL